MFAVLCDHTIPIRKSGLIHAARSLSAHANSRSAAPLRRPIALPLYLLAGSASFAISLLQAAARSRLLAPEKFVNKTIC